MNQQVIIDQLRKEVTELQARVKELVALKSKMDKLASKCHGLQKRVSFLEDQEKATTTTYEIDDLDADTFSTGGGS